VLNEDIVQRLKIPPHVLEASEQDEGRELARRELAYRGQREPISVEGRKIILVDDGLATGASMRVAVKALRQKNPAAIIVAVPIGSHETCEQFRPEVDEIICGECPEPFFSVGTWYSNFLQTTDEEVHELLDRAAHHRRVNRVQKQKPFLVA
jgi:predicted phosphoribosyltransferase